MMDNRAIGEILKKRIKEKGYSQEEFAYEVGLSYETLKNYLNGTSPYPVEYLIKFSEKLDCSFDYLLGYSKATKNENNILVEELGLSNEAIEKIKAWKNSNIQDISENMINALNKIICKDGFIYALAIFIFSNKKFTSLGEQFADSIINEPLTEIGLDVQKQLFLGMIFEALGELREENKGQIVISEESLSCINNMDSIKEEIGGE